MANREQVVLVGLIRTDQNAEKTHEYLDELSFLAETAGGEEIKRFVQSLPHPDPRTYVGSGKLDEVAAFVQEHEVETVIFDDELTSSQIRNIERIIANCKIIDRTRLILDIFSSHAQTAHAKIQVELAQYEYLLPRLTRMWTHLEKQRGGIGMRGPGEKEIETDRRIVRKRMSLLKERLKVIDTQKATQRSNRGAFVRVALVGYTNVGKSTLMNLLSKAETLTENKLFATLDTTVRKVVLENLPFLLSDTVGFIRKLPHGLIESFKSTLDEVRETHLLIHVVDVSHANFEEQIQVVEQTLLEIGAVAKPMILVFNKTDNYTWMEKEDDDLSPVVKENYSLSDLKRTWMAKSEYSTVFISAKEKDNIDELREIIYREVKKLQVKIYPYRTYPSSK
ncbi:MAG: GTPase HflX [Bacteroidales bacterium]|jgi:GTP-binding protein HflX|nr:GTPase HflX [Bacteroidales bacterium]